MNYAALISELLETSEHVSDTDPAKIRELLDHAVVAVRDLRDKIDRHPAQNVRDAVTFLEKISADLAVGDVPVDQCRSALKDASVMIEDLAAKSRSKIY
ncbi:hypothetical protein GGQ73_000378 [Rhizobium skierniewicense]|uniref:Uncharacterized protein n=1 Tax=Rhizobium skierniewicense TaxID=984260 RepID=A0A7W6C2D2_9HYPH|nr:hypothetical protein [Rhizobium skierniewicense]MBB3944455.1 hypothetical protein [Rhizobium skierniewicense]